VLRRKLGICLVFSVSTEGNLVNPLARFIDACARIEETIDNPTLVRARLGWSLMPVCGESILAVCKPLIIKR
jgi:hypothetical protein